MVVVFMSGKTTFGRKELVTLRAFYVSVFTFQVCVHLEVQELQRVWRRGGNVEGIGSIPVIGVLV